VDRVADERTNVPEIAEVAAGTISFEEFFEEHHRRLFSALCAATANRHEAEEVMQEAFPQALGALGSRLGPRGSRRLSLPDGDERVRKRLRRAKLAVRKAAGLADAIDAYDVIDARAVVIQGLRELRPHERAAVVLTSLPGSSSHG
jgi:hypothetical protein